jgi:glycosyltransferase involved in cell wall biosynthesis
MSDSLSRVAPARAAVAVESAAASASAATVVSVVIPVYNEEENLGELVQRVGEALLPSGEPFELIVVDDGSRDGSARLLGELAADRPWLRPLALIRNYGQSTALQAGFDHARGEFIVTLDGDLQNDPVEIPRLLALMRADPAIDLISGWRKDRQDRALSRKLPSMLANRLISRVTGVELHDNGCALKVYRAAILRNVRLYGEMHRFIAALAVEAGAKLVEVPVMHHPRTRGASKYGIDRVFRVLLDLLWVQFSLRFLHRPLHAFGGVGFVLMGIGGVALADLAFDKLVRGHDIGGRPLLLLGALLVLIGVQLLATGVIGELLTRVYHEPQGRRQYVLRPPTTSLQAERDAGASASTRAVDLPSPAVTRERDRG